MEQQYYVPAVANMAAYTTQAQMYPITQTPASLTPGPIMMGPPTEVYAHGKVYKLVDEPTTAASVGLSTADVGAEKTVNMTESEIVQKRVQQFMQKNSTSNTQGGLGKAGTAKDAFKSEMNKLSTKLKTSKR